VDVLLLADASAPVVLGGLGQLERLVRNLAEALAAPGRSPKVTVLWPSPADRDACPVPDRGRPLPLAVEHRVDGDPRPGAGHPAGPLLLLSTSLVLGRGTLARLLAEGAPSGDLPVRWVPAGSGPRGERWDWHAWAALLPRPSGAALPAGAGFAAVLDGGASRGMAEQGLFRSLGKPSDGYVARFLNRPLSTALTRVLAQTAVTPDRVSLGVLGLAIGAAWLVSQGSPAGFVLGCLLNQAASTLDGCDGELARLKFLDSRRGAWLDTAVDMVGNHLFILAMGIGLSRQPGLLPSQRDDFLWEGIAATVGLAFCVWAVARLTRVTTGEAHFNNFGSGLVSSAVAPGLLRRIVARLAPVFRRDVYALVFLALAALGRPALILHFFALGVVAHLPAIAWAWWHHHPPARLAGSRRGTQHA